ncbi:MAG: hypothetical protein U9P80_06080 [Thermodesulfobacteriota bacterium]|nr:hypothetical protein [Thermodesulfobacteriota bacterium]
MGDDSIFGLVILAVLFFVLPGVLKFLAGFTLRAKGGDIRPLNTETEPEKGFPDNGVPGHGTPDPGFPGHNISDWTIQGRNIPGQNINATMPQKGTEVSNRPIKPRWF